MLGESLPVFGNWFHLRFIENEGMAFGITFGDQIGKVLLSVGRILLTAFLIYYLVRLIRRNKANIVSVVVLSLIIAGALGNIIDSLFYGLIFSESTYYSVATLFPPEGGYAPLLLEKLWICSILIFLCCPIGYHYSVVHISFPPFLMSPTVVLQSE